MNDFNQLAEKQKVLTMWIIWLAILSGLFVMPFFAPSGPQGGTGISPATEDWTPLSIIGFVAAGLGLLCRILVVPRGRTLQAKLPLMVAGLALCEACGIIGLFVVDHALPRERIILFWTSVTCVLVSAPIYATSITKAPPYRQQ